MYHICIPNFLIPNWFLNLLLSFQLILHDIYYIYYTNFWNLYLGISFLFFFDEHYYFFIWKWIMESYSCRCMKIIYDWSLKLDVVFWHEIETFLGNEMYDTLINKWNKELSEKTYFDLMDNLYWPIIMTMFEYKGTTLRNNLW